MIFFIWGFPFTLPHTRNKRRPAAGC